MGRNHHSLVEQPGQTQARNLPLFAGRHSKLLCAIVPKPVLEQHQHVGGRFARSAHDENVAKTRFVLPISRRQSLPLFVIRRPRTRLLLLRPVGPSYHPRRPRPTCPTCPTWPTRPTCPTCPTCPNSRVSGKRLQPVGSLQ